MRENWTKAYSVFFSGWDLRFLNKGWNNASIKVRALLSGIKLNHDAWMDAHDHCRLIPGINWWWSHTHGHACNVVVSTGSTPIIFVVPHRTKPSNSIFWYHCINIHWICSKNGAEFLNNTQTFWDQLSLNEYMVSYSIGLQEASSLEFIQKHVIQRLTHSWNLKRAN